MKAFYPLLLLSLVACTSTEFIPDSRNNAVSTRKITTECEVKVYTNPPIGRTYKVLGQCEASSGATLSNADGSYNAFKKLQKCACKNGGNAVIIEGKEEKKVIAQNYLPNGTSYQINTGRTSATITATVVYMEPL